VQVKVQYYDHQTVMAIRVSTTLTLCCAAAVLQAASTRLRCVPLQQSLHTAEQKGLNIRHTNYVRYVLQRDVWGAA
jgi:hypothetical protein